ncbi:MAG: hypothetical protein ACM37W_23770 [Actinomycetota bacterium]
MRLTLFDQIGDWNPQLFRELRGRLKPRNMAIAAILSLIGQLLLLMSFWARLPVPFQDMGTNYTNRYCTGGNLSSYYYQGVSCFILNGKPVVHWQLWWLDVFIVLSLCATYILLTAGTFFQLADLEQEERRGTLNFIRLSPQSTESIFLGKLLGVPSLIYLAAIVALPLHFWSGLQAQIPLLKILTFDALLIAASIFTFSSAMLLSLVTPWLKGFQPWLGSGFVLFCLVVLNQKPIFHDSTDLLSLFNPTTILPYLIPEQFATRAFLFNDYSSVTNLLEKLNNWQWFGIPIGANLAFVFAFYCFNFSLWTAFIWKGLNRCFRSQNSTPLSKKQSYWITTCFTLETLGFSLANAITSDSHYFELLLLWNLFLFSVLIVALSPHRPTLQDWARYQQERLGSGSKYSLIHDLIWGEKSPAVVAIALNLLICAVFLVPAILLAANLLSSKPLYLSLISLVLNLTFLLICASFVQLLLFIKAPKRALWATVAFGTTLIAPQIILALLSIYPGTNWGSLWLLTSISWSAVNYASTPIVFQVLGMQLACLIFLNWQLTRQLRKAGESELKALLASRKTVPNRF